MLIIATENPTAAAVGAGTRRNREIRSLSWTKTEWEVLNMTETGNVVFAERLDRTQAGEKSVDLPCTGVFTSATERSHAGSTTLTSVPTLARCDDELTRAGGP